ncbi:hypothetical protein DID77_00625 [Candidatus Marinamargulisbacteria bacterium SCGC AG-439-L15]|nr:hypothetical protein DID77_00625 [Candidatus Marinamargulisbacteria bacterium SCGC AG-439-L15]
MSSEQSNPLAEAASAMAHMPLENAQAQTPAIESSPLFKICVKCLSTNSVNNVIQLQDATDQLDLLKKALPVEEKPIIERIITRLQSGHPMVDPRQFVFEAFQPTKQTEIEGVSVEKVSFSGSFGVSQLI